MKLTTFLNKYSDSIISHDFLTIRKIEYGTSVLPTIFTITISPLLSIPENMTNDDVEEAIRRFFHLVLWNTDPDLPELFVSFNHNRATIDFDIDLSQYPDEERQKFQFQKIYLAINIFLHLHRHFDEKLDYMLDEVEVCDYPEYIDIELSEDGFNDIDNPNSPNYERIKNLRYNTTLPEDIDINSLLPDYFDLATIKSILGTVDTNIEGFEKLPKELTNAFIITVDEDEPLIKITIEGTNYGDSNIYQDLVSSNGLNLIDLF